MKAKINIDLSDSDLSLQLSEGSTLSSDSDIPIKKKKQKPKKKKKSKKKYCICRKGYDGKEFMIECDDCKGKNALLVYSSIFVEPFSLEWFHGDCIGLKPNSVTDHYFCDSCTSKRRPPPLIILPPQQPQQTLPTISKLSINEDEDEDDICVLCDGDCTCGAVVEKPATPPPPPPQQKQQPKSITILPPLPKLQTKISKALSSLFTTMIDNISCIVIPVPKKRIGKSIPKYKQKESINSSSDEEEQVKPKKGKKLISKLPLIKSSSDEDEEVIIDDLDDLLETMSPLSDHSSPSDALENEEFFTDDDEEDIEEDDAATTPSSVHIDSGDDQDIEDEETKRLIQEFNQDTDSDSDIEEDSSDDEESDEETYSYTYVEDVEDDEEEEIPYGYSNHWSSSDDEFDQDEEIEFEYTNSDENQQQPNPFLPLLDSEGDFTFMNGEDNAFELAITTSEHFLRRPSLPSSALSAAQRMRGSQDINTSETLRALSNIDMYPIEEEEEKQETQDKKEPDSIDLSVLMNLLKSPSSSSQQSTSKSSRQILPKPSTLEQQIQDALNVNKRKAGNNVTHDANKRRKSRSNSLGTLQQHLQPLETSSFSTPASPAAIIDELEDILTIDQDQDDAMAVSMDDLVDTSQLYSRSLSPELEDDPYSKDLSRWQRIPIGAFRLMRSKNKLWLER